MMTLTAIVAGAVGALMALALMGRRARGRSIGAVLNAPEASEMPKTLRAKRFELVDETGKVRAVLGVINDVPGLALVDMDGEIRAALSVNEDGPSLALGDAADKLRAVLAVDKDEPKAKGGGPHEAA